MFGGASQSWAHHSDLVMYARRVLGDRSDTAEDVVQEAYLRLLGLAASDEAPTSARPWRVRVVRNLAIDERRSAARRADPVADPALLGTAALADTAMLVEQREEIGDAFRELAALPPRERRALEMDQAGIGAQEIAQELGTTPNAVHQALFRARRRMRNARAVAWGLIPIGLAPLVLRISDPALAMTFTNLPPGAPIGRALPVAGLVAAAMVGGSAVAPKIDHTPANPDATRVLESSQSNRGAFVPPTAVSDDTADNSGPSSNSGPGKASDDDDATTSRSGSNRGSDDDDATDDRRRRGSGSSGSSGSGSRTTTTSDDDSPSSSDRRRRGTTGTTTTTTTSTTSDDAPDEPDDGIHQGGRTSTTK